MKITKLYTLSQFVDEMKETPRNLIGNAEHVLDLIVKYNEFLKQRIDKSVAKLIVDNDMWRHKHMRGINETDHYQSKGAANEDGFICLTTKEDMGSFFLWHRIIDDYGSFASRNLILNLNDLAEATNGQLELKGVEI